MKKLTLISIGILAMLQVNIAFSQVFQFTDIVRNPASPVKNQASSGTCWAYATASFIESELLRTGKGEFDLSEMYVVRQNYMNRMNDNYLRRGKGNLGQGSLAHMFTNILANNGVIPQEIYNGINYDSKLNNHKELNQFVNAISAAAVELKQRSPEYYKLVNSLFDIYLGKVPEKFQFKGKEYTPVTFAQSLGLNMEDYVEITSFSHIPFYKKSVIEVPDNWDFAPFYNLPLDEFMLVMDNALKNGYTVCWDGDVSEKGFSHSNGVAIYPDPAENIEEVVKFQKIYPEVKVTQEIRQKGYESFVTTDDHLMHITGMVKDQNGTIYYMTKNSWGTERNKFGGYLNMSESYVGAKSISIMIHKDAVPKDIRKKLGI